MNNGSPSEICAVLSAIAPQSSATAKSTGWVAAGSYEYLQFMAQFGASDQTTIDVKIEMADDAARTNPVNVTGKASTQVSGATAANKQILIDFHRDNDLASAKPFVRGTITPAGGTATLLAGALLGFNPRFSPVTQAASVLQAVTGAAKTP